MTPGGMECLKADVRVRVFFETRLDPSRVTIRSEEGSVRCGSWKNQTILRGGGPCGTTHLNLGKGRSYFTRALPGFPIRPSPHTGIMVKAGSELTGILPPLRY